MIKIEIKITPNKHKDHYTIVERKSLWGWELSRKVDIIWLSPLVFSTEQSRQSRLYSLLLLRASRRYFLPHSLHLSISE